MTKVSVIMGVYNDEKYLKYAIESILNQSFTDFEFIICDDGSTDNSQNIIGEFKEIDKRIKFLKNPRNLGLAATLNRCIGMSKGEYIARMDSDDIALPDRLEKQVEFLDNHSDISIVGGNVYLFDEKGIFGIRKVKSEFSKINVFRRNFFIHPTVMMRMDALKEVGGYTEASYTYRTEDYDLWCKFYEKGFKGYNMDYILLKYREDRFSYRKRKFKYRVDSYKLKKMWFKRLDIPLKYSYLIFKPILVGLLPTKVIQIYHRMKAKLFNKYEFKNIKDGK